MTKLLGLALACMTACGVSEEGATTAHDDGVITIAVTPVSTPTRGRNTFSLEVGGHTATAVDVSAWMPAMGHGAPGEPHVVQESPSRYRIEEVTFSMPGTWELRVRVTCASGSDQRTFRYEVP